LTLITHLFSRRIIGYAFAKGMTVEDTTEPALTMAFRTKFHDKKTILHSDRGFQYFVSIFTDKFEENIKLPNTQNGDSYENILAKRLNGILKYEFELKDNFLNFKLAEAKIKKALPLYNSKISH
jgi:transposase InsO family protein